MADTLEVPVASSTGESSSEGSYIGELLGTADPGSVDGVLASDSSSLDEDGQIAQDAGVESGVNEPNADALFEQAAKEAGFEDVKNFNSAQRQALKKLIEQGKAGLGTPGSDLVTEELTDLEKQIAANSTAASLPAKVDAPAVKETATQQVPANAQNPGYGDIGDKWTGPRDAYAELGEAYQAGDIDKVHQVEGAMFARRFDAMARPFLEQQVAAGVQAALAKMGLNNVLPQVAQDMRERRSAQNQEIAKMNVSKLTGNDGFAKMFEPVEAGKEVTFRGEKYPDTPYNRIMMANPELLNIRVSHEDPNVAEQLTHVAIYRAANRLNRQLQQQQKAIQPEQAKQLVQAGAQILNRADADRTRQTMNAGVGATGAGSVLGKKGANGSYVSEINRPAGELSVSDLF